MAITGPLGLWKILKEVSVADIRKQSERVPRVVLCGTLEEREQLRTLLLAGSTDVIERSRFAQAVVEMELPLEGEGMVHSLSAQVLFTAVPPDESLYRLKVPVFEVHDEADLARVARQLAAKDEEWLLSLGRFIPGLRQGLAEYLTGATSNANAEIALLSALPGVVPLTEVLLPSAAVADIVLLTKNQVLLVLKLAAIFGKPVEAAERLWELAPVIGLAFGWRQLARELVGLVPGGVGVVAKAAVAYAGTFTAGRAAMFYYHHGRPLSRSEERQIYRDALVRGRVLAREMWERLRRKPRTAAPLPEKSTPLPEKSEEDANH